MSLLEVENLRVTYRTASGSVPALRGVDLAIEAGQKVGIAGESGCGKSTLALSLLRLLPPGTPVTGRICLDGEDILTMQWARLRAVRWAAASIVFQGAMHALNPVQRVGGQILEPILVHGTAGGADPAGRVSRLLGEVGLTASVARAYPHQLSGGQRQRVMIAMALACSPRLVVADEPTSALDVMVQAQILRLVGGLVADQGIGLVLISHDLTVLASTCDRLVVMYAGRIVEDGPAAEVLATPRHPYTAGLAAAHPSIGDQATRRRPGGLPGDPPDTGRLPGGCSFRPRCPLAVAECERVDPPLWPAGDGRRAACVHVRPAAPAQSADPR
jgi:peptide/nickel transport system ATP-binding protein